MKNTVLIILMILFIRSTEAQINNDQSNSTGLNLFINCSDCFADYVKDEVKFVTYVRERTDADINLLVTNQPTGISGSTYTFYFIGQNRFSGKNDTLTYFVKGNDSEDLKRNGFVMTMKAGLIRYFSYAGLLSQIDITSGIEKRISDTLQKDNWKGWLFDLSGNASLNGEQTSLVEEYSLSTTVNKTTEEIKFNFAINYNSGSTEYFYDTDILTSKTSSKGINGQFVKSIGKHWSVGSFSGSSSSTYSNIKLCYSIAPAVEYNLFPYSQAQRKLFTISWFLAYDHYDYFERTIYEKTQETLLENRVNINFSIIQPWGSMHFSLLSNHYLNDLSKNRFAFFSNTDLQLFKGLSFNLNFGYQIVHDQIFLAAVEESQAELLLHRKEIATSYFFFFNSGLSYTFGSKFNSVVNQRLNSGF